MVSINLDGTLIVQLVNFLLLVLALNYLLYRPIRKIMTERAELFDKLKDKAAKAKAEIESGEAEKARLKAESLRQGLNLKNELTAKSLEQEKSILADAQEKALRQTTEARNRLRQSLEQARAALSQESQNIARDMAEKVLGRKLN